MKLWSFEIQAQKFNECYKNSFVGLVNTHNEHKAIFSNSRHQS